MSKVLRTAAVVVGAVALVATGVGLAVGAAAAGAAIAGVGVSISTIATVASLASGALSLAAGVTAKKPTADATGSQTTFSANPDAGAPLALGRTGTAGDIVARFGWDTRDAGDNDRQAFVATLSLGPIAAIEGQTVDRNPVAYSGTGAAIGAFAGFMWSMTQLGALASPALGFGAGAGTPPGWTAQHALSGKAAATWTLRFDTKAKMYQNGVPSPMWTVRGILAYDPRKDSTYPGGSGSHRMADPADTAAYDAAMATWEWTEDPYLLGLKWAHGVWQRDVRDPNSKYQRVMGIGAPWAAIDVGAFVEGANVAQANGWTCGGFAYSGDGKWDSMKKILQAGMGEPLALGARISCFVNAPKVSLATVTIDDVVGPASVAATQPRRDRINTITPRFRLEANNWQHLPGAPISVAEHVAEDGGKRTRAVDYWLIQNSKQVGTAARYDIENAREFGPITLPVKLHWMGYKPGDCVTAQLPELGLNGQPILLLNRTLGAASGIVTLSARSETVEKHAFALGQTATPPPTPGVSGPPLVPVPAPSAWAITATSLISQAQTVPALVVSGSVDASTADAVVIEYRPFVSGQAIDAGWTSAGVWSVGVSRAEITSVRSGTAYEVGISYQRNGVTSGRRIIGPVATAGATIDFDGVTGANRPEDGATVGAPLGTMVGNKPVEIVIQQIEQIEQVKTDVSAIALAQVDHADELAILDAARIDIEASQRQLERDAGKLSEATLRLLAEANRTREVMRDAGIVVDPATGIVRIYAVDQVAERTTRAEIKLDAQAGRITQKADSVWVQEQIAKAVLDPSQVAELEPILRRLATAEQSIDGLNGAITSKAEVIEVTAIGGRVKTAEQLIDALNGEIVNKLEKTTFEGLERAVQSIEDKLSTVGDTVGMSVTIRQARLVADGAAESALRGLLSADEADRRQIVQITQARQELTTRMDAGLLTEATSRLALAVEVGAVRALTVAETQARISADEVAARDIRALGVTTKDQTAAIGRLDQAVINAEGGIAGTQMTIRQMAGRSAATDEATLRALIAGDEADRRRQAQLVQIQTELTTQLVANESSSAVARQALLARMGLAEAANVETRRVLADRVQAVVDRVEASEAVLADPVTGLPATRARLALEEKTSAERSQANAKAIETLDTAVNDPDTGLAAAFSTIGSVRDTASKANEATAKAVETLGSTVNDPDTGLAAAFSTIGSVRDTASRANQATAKAVETLGSTVNDPNTGLAAAFSTIGSVRDTASRANEATAKAVEQVRVKLGDIGEATVQDLIEAVVEETGRIMATRTVAIDINGNIVGTQLVGSREGPGSFNLVNADLKMGTGRVVFDTGTVMKVQGLGFGLNKDLVTWFGPTMPIDQCSRANGEVWEGTDGKAYWGAGLSAGVLHVARQTPDLAADASIVIGPFGTKGGSKVLVVSYAYELTRASTNKGSVTGKPTATIHLDRLDGESWSFVQSFDVTGTTEYEAPSVDGDGYGRQAMGGAITFTDTKAGLGDFTYRARITARALASFNFNSPNAGREVQALSISSTEE